MKKMLLLMLGFAGGLLVGLLLPDEQRLRLSRQLADGIERAIGQMPDA